MIGVGMAVKVERSQELEAPPGAVWSLLADTERLNRAVGLNTIHLTPHDDTTASRYLVRTVSAGFPMEYEERPFEWVEGRWFAVKRIVRKGALRSVENYFRLEPTADGGTRVTIGLVVEPKLALLVPIARFQAAGVIGRMLAQLRDADAALVAGEQAGYGLASGTLFRDVLMRHGDALRGRVGEDDGAVVERLLEMIASAPDADVERMRPFELARSWKVESRHVLRVFLHAVVAGLLELRWDLICPSCHTTAEHVDGLAQLGADAHCQLCDISFGLELDRAVEAVFRPAPAVRAVGDGRYCIGGPMNTPHVVVQAILPAEGITEVSAPAEPGDYRLFVRGGLEAKLHADPAAPQKVALEVGARRLDSEVLRVAPGGTLVVAHRPSRERHLKIERQEARQLAATAHVLATVPEFRRMFDHQVLRAGVSLKVGRVAVLFTDLKDSTALYAEIGDARAYRLVQDHFEALLSVVEAHEGALVKTIGDAIMAAFDDEKQALRCALAMPAAFAGLAAHNPDANRSGVRIGVHVGSCFAVTFNGIFDYFGQHINLAARLQGEAEAGQVVTTEELADEAIARGWIEPSACSERFVAHLKGIDGPVRAVCLVSRRGG